jgi:hypothetical protein
MLSTQPDPLPSVTHPVHTLPLYLHTGKGDRGEANQCEGYRGASKDDV